MRPASQRFFIHSCIYLRMLIMSYLATFLGTNGLSVLMCRKAVNQSINHGLIIVCCPTFRISFRISFPSARRQNCSSCHNMYWRHPELYAIHQDRTSSMQTRRNSCGVQHRGACNSFRPPLSGLQGWIRDHHLHRLPRSRWRLHRCLSVDAESRATDSRGLLCRTSSDSYSVNRYRPMPSTA